MQPWGKVMVHYQGMHTTVFELFCKYKTSTTCEELLANYSMFPKHGDLRLVGTRRLMMLTPT